MTDKTDKPRRLLTARRTVGLGAMAAAMTATAPQAAILAPAADASAKWVHTAAGEGEGEGEGEGAAAPDPDIRYLRDLGVMEGHLRAGLALYDAGDLAAAKTHLGSPLREKYGAVEEMLQAEGYENLKTAIAALADAIEAEADVTRIRDLSETVAGTIAVARSEKPAARQIMGLVELTRLAGDAYTAATEGGTVSGLLEYRTSWGFMQVVGDEAARLAQGDGPAAEVAAKVADHAAGVSAAFGDLQGEGAFEIDAGLFFGAAARMELAAARLD
jgi:hypothetical protein